MYFNLNKFYELIKMSNTIVIAGHIAPDGDAISASYALALAIFKKFKKEALVILENYPERYNFLKGRQFLYKGSFETLKPDLFISIDCGDESRLGSLLDTFKISNNTVNIDHHISNNHFAKINFVNNKASSTSEVIFEIIKDLQVIDDDIAILIYTGIVFDTYAFKHKSTSSRTHQIVSNLLEYNIDTSLIHTKILYSQSITKAKVFAESINNTVFEDRLAYTTLTFNELNKKFNAQYSDTEGFSSYLLDIENIEVSALFFERKDKTVKVSLRSKYIDINKIATKFGGGGHKLASGILLDMPIQKAKDLIVSEIKTYL